MSSLGSLGGSWIPLNKGGIKELSKPYVYFQSVCDVTTTNLVSYNIPVTWKSVKNYNK